MIGTIISVAALVLILFLAIRYIIKAKKKGIKCIGCPSANSCTSTSGCTSDIEKMEAEIRRQIKKSN